VHKYRTTSRNSNQNEENCDIVRINSALDRETIGGNYKGTVDGQMFISEINITKPGKLTGHRKWRYARHLKKGLAYIRIAVSTRQHLCMGRCHSHLGDS